MTIYVFLYNVVPIKSNLSQLKEDQDSTFILIGSDYCLQHLSDDNQKLFQEIHGIHRNFHQPDLNEVETILLNILERYDAKNIRLLTNEDSTQLTCATLREKYGIPGNNSEQVLPFVNKLVSKSKLAGKIRTPRFLSFDKTSFQDNPEAYLSSIIEYIGFPMFIKPIDLVSSIDTYHVPDVKTLRNVLNSIVGKSWDFEIDEFIEGDLFHCDVIIREHRIEFFMAGKYAWPLAKFSKGSPMGSLPINDSVLFAQLRAFSENALTCLGQFSSAFHLEVFKDHKSGEFIFLEAAARTPGALVPDMYKLIFNRHLEELHYHVQMYPDQELGIEQSETFAGWVTFPKVKGTLLEIKQPSISINNNLNHYVQSGEKMEQAVSLLDSSCSVVFWDDCYRKAEQTFEYLRHYQPLILNEAEG
ncbi:hypothetical protein EAS68_02910 [Legionella jordanis]|uniref:ATP-grasp domain-containing protein n=1 Tax=Legionella jordanis TaxID=456 RepID=UPI000EFE4B30|nr:hypothetical protein [Legionella jordanis]RMX21720.1 hypothetical protein EAS68_02910 [Legionella jordanis]